jgi:hypothetical protein
VNVLGVVVTALALTSGAAAQPAQRPTPAPTPAPAPAPSPVPPTPTPAPTDTTTQPADGATAPPVAPPPAEQAFIEGRALLDAGNHAEACAKFETSIRLDPNAAGTMLNLGLCNERLGKTATALAWFRKAQLRAAETNMADYEDVAKNNTFMLAVRVPTVRIVVTNQPAGSKVYVGDRLVPDAELGKVELDPGTHAVELRITGAAPVRRDITLKDGEQDKVITLAPPPPPPTTYVEIDRGVQRRRLAYLIGAGGVVLWGGSLALSLVARDNFKSSEHPEDWRSAQHLARFGATSVFLVGTAAVVGAAYLYVKAPGVERVERTAVTPVINSSGAGLVVTGAF